MKRKCNFLLLILLLCSLCACGMDNRSNSKEAVEDSNSNSTIDVDLTALSSTMVYGEVYNMMVTPEEYVGKTIKMCGKFATYQPTDEDGNVTSNQIGFACIIADATACCSQGLEFVLEGDYSYPDDYPELGEEITIIGTFETYEENGHMFCHLIDAEIIRMNHLCMPIL